MSNLEKNEEEKNTERKIVLSYTIFFFMIKGPYTKSAKVLQSHNAHSSGSAYPKSVHVNPVDIGASV